MGSRPVPYWKIYDGCLYIVINHDPAWGFIPACPLDVLSTMTLGGSFSLTSWWGSKLTVSGSDPVTVMYSYNGNSIRQFSATIELNCDRYREFVADGWRVYGTRLEKI